MNGRNSNSLISLNGLHFHSLSMIIVADEIRQPGEILSKLITSYSEILILKGIESFQNEVLSEQIHRKSI